MIYVEYHMLATNVVYVHCHIQYASTDLTNVYRHTFI
jgi:hypothetical protein